MEDTSENPYLSKTPGQLGELLMQLTHKQSMLSDELGRILYTKDLNWSILRDTVTSDKQADQLWRMTKQGSQEREIEREMKKIKMQMSNIKRYLNVKADEAKNLY